ncbi:flagellar basal body-associated FliL family protein [Paenibacillus sonchi]|uniref:Flagellar protein FliL n=4 Tax=Paenibacillus TaxID=44249 RepID=A0A1G9N8A2_9BACL|nr:MULTISPECIES: flagellar basal body-associated FliL family protein [Paenibacillus]KWX72567.1 flagellar basal body protein FliL [Paenibacillus riograndensis]KWX75590.1 flagellar basal body protein FliL [Paenibacillus jilunlii]KWX86386.1 flagellar basal body protein FliL [Paenibacillus riograndensis]MCE3201534.1 flagellar basal body-associated FliL family protein [Paenibacillus sonchi]QQZ60334.1 flagellar basal body-associated FliL family protein [Paenibacillus sonchi]
MKKMLPWLITILLAITLIVVAAFLLMDKIFPSDSNDVNTAVQSVETKKLSADEIVALTAEITDIKTNTADPDYILKVNIAFQLDSAKSKEEFEKIKAIKITPLIIKAIADAKPEDLNGASGKDQFSSKLMNIINKNLTEGTITQLEFTDFVLASM